MANSQMARVVGHLRQVALPRGTDALTDGQLLERFLTSRDDAAFAAIMRRHGPMVLGVCRRILSRVHDAEDAFQATFLVLVCKGGSISARESVASWLHGVAYRTAHKARAAAALRRAKERQMARPEAVDEPGSLWRELRPLIDQELNELPQRYRDAILLCDLEGRTRKEAAQQLGCPEGTVAGRLARARALLAKRLARHGLAVSSGALVALLAGGTASACVRAPLLSSTIKAAALVAAGHAAAGAVAHPVAALTEGVLKSMGMSKLKLVLTAVLAVALIGAGLGIYHSRAADPQQTQVNPAVAAPEQVGGPAVVGQPVGGLGGGGGIKVAGNVNLPQGAAPTQVLASIDKDGKLVIKRAFMTFRPINVPGPGGPPVLPPGGGFGGVPAPPAGGGVQAVPGKAGGGVANPAVPAQPPLGGGQVFPGQGGGGGGGIIRPGIAPAPPGQFVMELRAQTYDLDNVVVLDTNAKKLDKKTVLDRLKKETPAMASYNQTPDPLHLRVLKDDILTFVLPVQRFPGVIPPGPPGIPGVPGIPVPPAPPLPPGGGGAGGAGVGATGVGVAQPGVVVPAVPGAPSPPEQR